MNKKHINKSGPLSISWDLTNRCNFNCNHCLNRSADQNIHCFKDELSYTEVLKTIDYIIEMNPETVCLCGGEPTLNKYFSEIAYRLTSAGVNVNMVTNGSTINETNIKTIKESGFKFIQVSLDSHIEELHDEFRDFKGSYKRVLRTLRLLKENGIKAGIAMCPTRFNARRLEEYLIFIKSKGINYLRIMPLLPMGRGFDNFLRIEPSKEDYSLMHSQIVRYRKKGFIIEWGDPLEHIHIPIYAEDYYCYNIEIKSTGEIGPSIYLPITVGNVKRHSLKAYWEKGLNQIWENNHVYEIAKKINTIEDFKDLSLRTWSIMRKEIDIIDDLQ